MNKLSNGRLFARAILDSFGVFAYVFLISLGLGQANKIFTGPDNKLLSPVVFLLLFVFSALTTGYLILGKPVTLYLDNEKKAGLKLLAYTIFGLAIFLVISIVILYLAR